MTTPDRPSRATNPGEQAYPGRRLGLPRSGVGSIGPMGRRIAAFLVDLLISFLIALLFTRPELPRNWSLVVWAVMTVLGVGMFGGTPGQQALGLRVASTRGRSFVGLWALPRTLLVFLLVPPLLLNQDSRGLHDRLCRTVVLRGR